MLRRALALVLLTLVACSPAPEEAVPDAVIDPARVGFFARPVTADHPVRLLDLQRRTVITATRGGLAVDLGRSALQGRVALGPYYGHEPDVVVDPRYRSEVDLVNGQAELRPNENLREAARLRDAGWTDHFVFSLGFEFDRSGESDVATARRLHAWWRNGRLEPVVSFVEGPLLALRTSDHPSWFVVALETDRPSRAAIEVEGVGRFAGNDDAHRHEIRVEGLRPARRYRYRALAYATGDSAATPWIDFETAPSAGTGSATFVYGGDSRAGRGFGRHRQLGVNHFVLGAIARGARRHDVDFMLFGGDLVNGYNLRVDDFRTELRSWKQAIAPLGVDRPVFTALGNHDVTVRGFYKSKVGGLNMDRWPYDTESGEAVFADELVLPTGAPTPRPGLPPYEETIYAFTHGPLRVIVFNNNYWFTTHDRIGDVGGNPEGYLLSEQLEWIERELARAAADPAVRYVILCAQEPVWPVAGHVADAMWHDGKNHRRALRHRGDGTLEELGPASSKSAIACGRWPAANPKSPPSSPATNTTTRAPSSRARRPSASPHATTATATASSKHPSHPTPTSARPCGRSSAAAPALPSTVASPSRGAMAYAPSRRAFTTWSCGRTRSESRCRPSTSKAWRSIGWMI